MVLHPSGHRLRTAAWVLLLSGAVSSCAPVTRSHPARAAAAPLRQATVDEVLAAFEAYCAGVSSLSASGDLDVRDLRAGKAKSMGVRLVASRGGRLYLKGSVAVVTAIEVSANGERFWFQVPSRRTVWTGPAESGAAGAEAESAPYYALRPADVLSALLPEPLAPAAGEAVVVESDLETFSVVVAGAAPGRSARRRVWLDRSSLEPVRLRRYDARGDVLSDVALSGWRAGRPQQIEVRRPRDGYEASLRFDKADWNAPVPERAFAPRTPEGYAVVEVQ